MGLGLGSKSSFLGQQAFLSLASGGESGLHYRSASGPLMVPGRGERSPQRPVAGWLGPALVEAKCETGPWEQGHGCAWRAASPQHPVPLPVSTPGGVQGFILGYQKAQWELGGVSPWCIRAQVGEHLQAVGFLQEVTLALFQGGLP